MVLQSSLSNYKVGLIKLNNGIANYVPTNAIERNMGRAMI